ncbi:hypothetical protein MSIMFB_02628 [Mycobacterium simulans]|uniref:Uncharacterized protein n=1 Tax=Mycobacterium simulans TaxID=627089 RepID=A0A7Z7IME9_9MYCO|nr:hypothetical protein MSIMFB_02628 [Mycobacterium simulans]
MWGDWEVKRPPPSFDIEWLTHSAASLAGKNCSE